MSCFVDFAGEYDLDESYRKNLLRAYPLAKASTHCPACLREHAELVVPAACPYVQEEEERAAFRERMERRADMTPEKLARAMDIFERHSDVFLMGRADAQPTGRAQAVAAWQARLWRETACKLLIGMLATVATLFLLGLSFLRLR